MIGVMPEADTTKHENTEAGTTLVLFFFCIMTPVFSYKIMAAKGLKAE